jgi:hypothetical protein
VSAWLPEHRKAELVAPEVVKSRRYDQRGDGRDPMPANATVAIMID